MVANKAGIGLAFDYRHTSFLFVTAHFAAHQFKVKQRNDDFNRIDRGLFPLMCPKLSAALKSKKRGSATAGGLGMITRQLSMSTGGLPVLAKRASDSFAEEVSAQPNAEVADDAGTDDDVHRASTVGPHVRTFASYFGCARPGHCSILGRGAHILVSKNPDLRAQDPFPKA